MEIKKKWLYWSVPAVCAIAQVVAAVVDYDAWIEVLPNQTSILYFVSCLILPFLVAGFFAGWLLILGFKFEQQSRASLLWSSIKAKILFYGTVIGLFSFFSVLGGMITWNTDFYWGIISYSCILVVPPALSFSYEYQQFRKLLPGVPQSSIAACLAATFALSVLIVIMLAIVILPALFIYGWLVATV